MRLLSFAHHFSRLFVLADVLVAVATIVASCVLAVVRYGASVTWHSLQSFGIAAYRVVGSLKPVYRESYDTHGLSFDAGRMRC
ncbi:hypothetical protein CN233_17945 [Sinorhizobium meliloti]|uniref:hypothetical protein n=1 Tax=Rhizobium meliloti TaxID=382 RepID=UPI000FD9FA0A|nr:hypothetical protein [Sinorhizobium meliloti]RVG29883.1 hypothetical protein CN233_17945 [Sinorhizobium meliloti]